MANRPDLYDVFTEILGNKNVYFNPPISIKMSYPCIRCILAGKNVKNANDSKYQKHNRYTVTIIDYDSDSEIPDRLEELPYCTLDRTFCADGLNHFVYTLYY